VKLKKILYYTKRIKTKNRNKKKDQIWNKYKIKRKIIFQWRAKLKTNLKFTKKISR
jgi:hypothetical protein